MRYVIAVCLAATMVAGASGRASEGGVDCVRTWSHSATGTWLRHVVEVAGYEITGCADTAWVAITPVTSFAISASGPWRPPAGLRPATEPYLRGAYTDGTRVAWQAQGLGIWVEPAGVGGRLPGRSAFGWLQVASRRLPRAFGRLRFMPTPRPALRACRSDKRLAPACPTRIPRLELRSGPAGLRTYPSPPRDVEGIFGMQLGGEIPGRPELMRPPGNVHVEVEVTSERLFGMRLPWPGGETTAPRDGLVHETRASPVLLARVTWNGKRGSVVLAPAYPDGGSQGNHVVFRWRERGRTYAVGMHAWEPFTEAFATLRRVVESLPR